MTKKIAYFALCFVDRRILARKKDALTGFSAWSLLSER